MPYNYKFHFYKVQKYPFEADSFYSHTCHLEEHFHNNNNKNITYAYVIAHYKIMQMHSYFLYLTHLGITYHHSYDVCCVLKSLLPLGSLI